ncbi:hypothetical protein DYBT9623_04477 [Dyadobacter sp. CECT 9623]|uniref:Uncharacterized protein n=1 Tax=Dyadobacter linearis TaxID=2823330 RepID=A0ABM8UVX5_9BACT|nr:hypothetical protein [Dyadobacter sp. CECT 9623]CAG5072941.1 hypothetical protein DYBT9623_04477 [Dyadobacter sp. CECT 9623]
MIIRKGIARIKEQLGEKNHVVTIPLMKAGQSFTAKWDDRGVWVDNLDKQPLLPWAVFETAIELMIEKDSKNRGAHVLKGNAVGHRLGTSAFPLDSIEGRVAHVVFGKKIEQTAFRKISAIVGVLSFAGICTNGRGYVTLNQF